MPQLACIGEEADRDESVPDLDVGSILAIHRDPNGYIGFVRKPDPAASGRVCGESGRPYTWENLFSIRADDLRSMFPVLVDWLARDSYMTVHAYYCAAPYRNKTTGLPDVWRKEKYLRSLTACYVDLDCGRQDSLEPGEALDWRQAQHEVEYLADSGVIPQPSIMARSGRGVYVFWLLRDAKDPTKLPRAWPEKIELYKACNRALNERLRFHRLPADGAAVDAARVLRVPGSIHRTARRRVCYVIQADEHGRGFIYTLPEMAAALGLPGLADDLPEKTRSLAKPARFRRVRNPGCAPLRSHGYKARHALIAGDMLTILALRLTDGSGGWQKRNWPYADGHRSPKYGRRMILTLYARALVRSMYSPKELRPPARIDPGVRADVLSRVVTMGRQCKPTYPSDPNDATPETILDAVLSEYKPGSGGKQRLAQAPSTKTLCAAFGITADMARELDLKTIRPRELAVERDRARLLQAEVIQARRDFARQYLELIGRVTARRLAKIYAERGFPGANRQTANQDLNAIGYVVRDSRGGRPRKEELRIQAAPSPSTMQTIIDSYFVESCERDYKGGE